MKEIKDYLHFYLGCEMMLGKIRGNRQIYTLESDSLIFAIEDGDKPILRPLSDITTYEKEMAVDPMLYGLSHCLPSTQILQSAELVRFLLSKQFDIFGLIESGLAIDKTLLKS